MKILITAAALCLAAATGCKSTTKTTMHDDMHHMAMMKVGSAIAVVHPTQGNAVAGTVRFTQAGDDSVRVVADLVGLAPNSAHGFHIHEFGDCSAPDGTSAGGHYNPEGHTHGPMNEHHHAGDLGNVTANAEGNVHLEVTLDGVTINGHHNPILGRSVVVHAKADDLRSQPAGESGPRIGCGVIGAAKPQ